MKKRFAIVISLLLCAFLLLGTFGAVSAKPMPTSDTTSLPDPTVTPISGNTKFSVDLLSMQDLPGVTTLDSGMLIPTGFPSGEKQFEGKGVQISGFTYGSAKVCFPVVGVNQGWGGQVGTWNGSKWDLLPTTITAVDEQPYSLACATVSANGTYALIDWVVDPSKLPSTGECQFGIKYQWEENYGYAFGPYIYFAVPSDVPTGTLVTYSDVKIDPAYTGTMISGESGSTKVGEYFTGYVIYPIPILFSGPPYPGYFSVRFEFPTLGCHLDLKYLSYPI
jgi:hypothetical protein